MIGSDPGPALGFLADNGGLEPLHVGEVQLLRLSLRILRTELVRRDSGVPANVAVLAGLLERVVARAESEARIPTVERLGTFGNPVTPVPDNLGVMDIDEVAKLLDCSTRNDRYMAGRGTLRGVKRRNRWAFDRLSGVDLLQSRQAS